MVEFIKLGSLVDIRTGKLNANAANENGCYPFFTCSVEPLTINTYAYDCESVLIAGNGDLNVKYYNGKFNAYQRTYIIESKDKDILSVRFLYYFLCEYIDTLRNNSIGGVIKYIKLSDLTDINFPLIPIKEQQSIVKILDKTEEIRTKKKLANEKLDEFLKSTFIDMFGDPVTNPKGYNVELIKNIGTVVTGNTPPRTNEEYYGNYIEWIKSDNINTPYTYLTKAEEYLSELGMQKGRVVPKNSILVTCIAGSFNCIGNVALTDRSVAFNQQINAIIPEKKYINSAFLYEQLYIGKKLIQEKSTNSMKGMVSKSKFETIKLILPDLKEQELFEKIFVEVEKQKEKNQKVIEQMDNLFNSLMQQAFNGEL